MLSLLLPALLLPLLSHAHHDGPHTPEEVKAYRDLQAAAYLCAPTVAAYTAERKRAFAQQVLGSDGHSLAADDLFSEGSYGDLPPKGVQKYLSCNTVEETRIRNNTCVLGESECIYPRIWKKLTAL